MAERSLIAAIQARLGKAGGRVLVGPGDDAAVVRADGVSVTSIDTVVDGVHFELATHSPGDVGHKALATALSDIAAMGAEPGEAYVSVVLPERFAALE
ncbi:MAG: thiamine-monophosphate kinase, partial [Thermoleophilaceae bacterium]|nr:thiamine-monophosphate kinase [Thermoleophilaceae bacterium]